MKAGAGFRSGMQGRMPAEDARRVPGHPPGYSQGENSAFNMKFLPCFISLNSASLHGSFWPCSLPTPAPWQRGDVAWDGETRERKPGITEGLVFTGGGKRVQV